jgi:formate dehydrogenase major subunit
VRLVKIGVTLRRVVSKFGTISLKIEERRYGMKVTRREFLVGSGTLVGGLALSSLGIDMGPLTAYADEMKKIDKVKSAKQSTSICCYCAVGCGLICSTDTKTGKIINIEGDPEHPINEGTLCAKGAGIFQTTAANEHRLTKVLYRAPYSDKWEVKTWDWAITQIAKKIKATRDKNFIEKNDKGQVVNRLETIAHMGSSNVDNEECWLITAMARSMGLTYIDHQARV